MTVTIAVALTLYAIFALSLFWRGVNRFRVVRVTGIGQVSGCVEAVLFTLGGLIVTFAIGRGIYRLVNEGIPEREVGLLSWANLIFWVLLFLTLAVISYAELREARSLRTELLDITEGGGDV